MTEMKTLGNLTPAKGSKQRRKRVGRGIGSGLGKTAGRGHGGQKSRSGGKVAPGFEGGQMPLYRRLPKRGFKNIFRIVYNEINLDQLGKLDSSVAVTPEVLIAAGLVKDKKAPIKLLGRGELAAGINIKVHKASKSAAAAVEKAGGKVELIVSERKPVVKKKKKS